MAPLYYQLSNLVRWRQMQNVIVIGIQLMFLLDVTAYRKVQQTENIETNQLCNRKKAPHLNGHMHDNVIKWKHFPHYCLFVRGIHRSPVNYTHKGQCRGALMFSLIGVWINGWLNNREAGDLRCYRAHYDVIVMVHNDHNQCLLTWRYKLNVLQQSHLKH